MTLLGGKNFQDLINFIGFVPLIRQSKWTMSRVRGKQINDGINLPNLHMAQAKLPPISYLHDEDAFALYLVEDTPATLRLCDIYMYPYNQNVNPVWIAFFDLEPRVRDGILRQVARKYPGRSIIV